MTPQQQQFFQRAQARVARLMPEVASAVLAAFRILAASLSESDVAKILAAGLIEQVVTELLDNTTMDRAFIPLRRAIRDTIEQSFRWNVPYFPKGGKVNGTVAVMFDRLNSRVITAISTLETRVITSLQEDIRETVRQHIARGLENQVSPRTIAKGLRDVIGLAPRQEQAVATFEQLLRNGDREALTRLLRDRRFDKTLDKALGVDGKGLSESQIETMTNAYRRKAVALNANTIASTATKDAYKIAQRESWQAAIDAGIVEPGRLMREWIGVADDRERPSHVEMNNTVVPFDSPYPNGQMYPGENEYNCRCIDRFFIARAA